MYTTPFGSNANPFGTPPVFTYTCHKMAKPQAVVYDTTNELSLHLVGRFPTTFGFHNLQDITRLTRAHVQISCWCVCERCHNTMPHFNIWLHAARWRCLDLSPLPHPAPRRATAPPPSPAHNSRARCPSVPASLPVGVRRCLSVSGQPATGDSGRLYSSTCTVPRSIL